MMDIKKIIRRTLYFVIGFIFAIGFSMKLEHAIAFHTKFPLKSLTRAYIDTFKTVDQASRIQGFTPIQIALYSYYGLKRLDIIEVSPLIDLFLKKGVDINAKDERGMSALFVTAAFEEDPVGTKLLIDKGANVNTTLSREGSQEWTIVQYLKEKKSRNDVKNPEAVSQIEQMLYIAGAR